MSNEMWLAIIFADRRSNDDAYILGVFSSREGAVKRLLEYYGDDAILVDENDNDPLIGYTNKHGRFDIVGQAVYMLLDEYTNFNL